MFIYCYAPDGSLRAWSGGQWVECLDLTNGVIPACYAGSLVNVTFTNLFHGAGVAGWAGAHIYAGYGRDQADMLLNGKAQLIGVVADPFQTRDACMTNVVLKATILPRQFDWQGYAGFQYEVMTSTNLLGKWESAGHVTGAFGTLVWPVAADGTPHFYRLRIASGDTP